MIGPCCFGIPLKRGVKFIALFEMATGLISAVGTVILLGSMWNDKRSNPIEPTTRNSSVRMISDKPQGSSDGVLPVKVELESAESRTPQEAALIFLLMILIGEIALSWILYRGATQEKFRHLRTWWWIKLALMVIFIVFNMIDVFTRENRKLEFVLILQVLYQGYVLWIVKALIDEIRGVGPPRFTQLTPPSASIEIEEDV